MKEIFERRRFPWRAVERIRLSAPSEQEAVGHVVRGFLAGGKVIERDLAREVCASLRWNLSYINNFCAICDSLTRGYVTRDMVAESMDELLSMHEPRFISAVNDLTTYQTRLLRAVLEGETKFSSAEVITRYGLSSSANVKRLKDALLKKEILTFGDLLTEENPEIIDPLFEYWLRKVFFR